MKVDISGVNVEKFDDKYFVREKKKATKTEGELLYTGGACLYIT
jgi:large subunit ribosomal protein L6e